MRCHQQRLRKRFPRRPELADRVVARGQLIRNHHNSTQGPWTGPWIEEEEEEEDEEWHGEEEEAEEKKKKGATERQMGLKGGIVRNVYRSA